MYFHHCFNKYFVLLLWYSCKRYSSDPTWLRRLHLPCNRPEFHLYLHPCDAGRSSTMQSIRFVLDLSIAEALHIKTWSRNCLILIMSSCYHEYPLTMGEPRTLLTKSQTLNPTPVSCIMGHAPIFTTAVIIRPFSSKTTAVLLYRLCCAPKCVVPVPCSALRVLNILQDSWPFAYWFHHS